MNFPHFYDLRAKGVDLITAAEMSEIDWQRWVWTAVYIFAFFFILGLIDHMAEARAEDRAAPHRKHATENIKALTMCMNGQAFVLEDGNLLLTEKAYEVRWKK